MATLLSAAVTTVVLLSIAPARGQTQTDTPPPTSDETPAEPFVIPPGQEDVLAQILGQGATLPGQCKFTDGQANGPVVRGTYTCANGEVVVELRHPDEASANLPHTAQFVVVVQSGSPPAGMIDALLANIRAHESGVRWLDLRPHSNRFAALLSLVAAGLLVLIALTWALRRRRRAP